MGVDIGNGDLDVNNWSSRIESFRNVLFSWRQSSLSFQGKALVTNGLALSGLWYMASVLPMPDWALKDINKLLFDFFWKGKKELVACNVVVQPRSSGSFSVVAVALKVQDLHAQWIKRFLVSPSRWSSFLSFWTYD